VRCGCVWRGFINHSALTLLHMLYQYQLTGPSHVMHYFKGLMLRSYIVTTYCHRTCRDAPTLIEYLRKPFQTMHCSHQMDKCIETSQKGPYITLLIAFIFTMFHRCITFLFLTHVALLYIRIFNRC